MPEASCRNLPGSVPASRPAKRTNEDYIKRHHPPNPRVSSGTPSLFATPTNKLFFLFLSSSEILIFLLELAFNFR